MLRSVLAFTTGVAMLAGAMIVPATAATLGNPDGVRGALADVNPIEQAGCYRRGWHGWGWYPVCHRHWGYGYGWRHRHWHRWHRHWY